MFHGDFAFQQNFTPDADNVPPLINFRSAICGPAHPFAWKLLGCSPPLLRQYSGYVERIRPPVYGILPCTTSTELFPFRYTMRIARGNLFPQEARPLAWLGGCSHTLPTVDLLETRLKLLRLQENTALFGDQPLPITQLNDILQIDLHPFFNQPLDEGFALEIGSTFTPGCAFTGSLQTMTRVQLRYPDAGFHDPVLRTAELPNLTGDNSAAPKLALVPEDSVFEVSTEQFELDFLLRNLVATASPNTCLSTAWPARRSCLTRWGAPGWRSPNRCCSPATCTNGRQPSPTPAGGSDAGLYRTCQPHAGQFKRQRGLRRNHHACCGDYVGRCGYRTALPSTSGCPQQA